MLSEHICDITICATFRAIFRYCAIFKAIFRYFEPSIVILASVERLQNGNEEKTKTQMTQYSKNGAKIWRQNNLNEFNRVSSFSFRNPSGILLVTFNYRGRGTCGPSTLNYSLNGAANA